MNSVCCKTQYFTIGPSLNLTGRKNGPCGLVLENPFWIGQSDICFQHYFAGMLESNNCWIMNELCFAVFLLFTQTFSYINATINQLQNSNYFYRQVKLQYNQRLKMNIYRKIQFRFIFNIIMLRNVLSFICYLLTVYLVSAFTESNPTWLSSPYFRADNQNVISTLTGNSSTPAFTFTFSSSLSGIPTIAYGIKGYQGRDRLIQEFIQIRMTAVTQSTFSVKIQISGVTNIFLLNVAYIAGEPTFPHHLNSFDNVPINYTSGPLVNISTLNTQVTTFTELINYTKQAQTKLFNKFDIQLSSNKILLFITSFFISGILGSSSMIPFQIEISYQIIDQSFYTLTAKIFQRAQITRLHFSQIIFNQKDVKSSNQYFLVYQIWTTDMNGGFKEIPIEFIDNFIMGMQDFKANDIKCTIQYIWNFKYVNGKHGVQLQQSVPSINIGLSQMRSTIFYIKTWICPPPFYFFNLTTNKCQDICGETFAQQVRVYNGLNRYRCVSQTQTYCGDGVCVTSVQECDDGNLDNMDGCSQLCKKEEGFQCQLPAPPATQLSDCSYVLSINFTIVFLEKVQGANQVKAQMTIHPLLKAFQTFDFKSLVSTDLPASDYKFQYDALNGILNMVLTYEESIQGFQATVTINPPQNGVFRLTPSVSKNIVMTSRDNSGLYVYSSQAYAFANTINVILIVLSVMAWILFIIGLFAGKMVAIQMFAVFQISFFGLMTVQDMNPTLSILKNLFIANGFNKFLVSNPYTNPSMPQQISGIGLDHQYLNNFNINIAFMSIPLIISLITFILSRTLFKQNQSKNKLISQICIRSFGEYTFTMIVFSGYLISVSVVLQFVYGFNLIQGALGIISIPMCFLMIAAIAFYFVLLLVKPQLFGEYKTQFDPNQRFSYFFYNYMLIQRILIGVMLTALYFLPYSLLFPILVFLIELVFFIIKKPYKKNRHSYRMIANNVFSIAILSVYMYFGIDPSASSDSNVAVYIPIVVVLLLAACLVLNGIFIIHIFAKWIKKQCQQKINQNNLTLQMSQSKTFRDYMQIQNFKPSPLASIGQQKERGVFPQIQKLQNSNQKNKMMMQVQLQMQIQMGMHEVIEQKQNSLQNKMEKQLQIIQKQEQILKNALESIKQINKQKKQLKKLQNVSHKTNLLQYEDL